MKITMRVTAAGPAGVKMSGHTYDVPDAEGNELIKGGYASLAPAAKAEPKAAVPAAKPSPAKDYVPAPEPEEEKSAAKVKTKSR